MARVSEDGASWKASGVKRRDFRSDTHATADTIPVSGGKKTRRWCRGKVGVEHEFVAADDRVMLSLGYVKLVCSRCGKTRYRKRAS